MSVFVPDFERKILDPIDLVKTISGVARPLVLTNGVFDILHRGHVTYLAEARAQGCSLLVAVNSDTSVRGLGKGANRPINPLADRLALLASLSMVDWVTWFDEPTPLVRIHECRPDILVKGGDWSVSQIVGAEWVQGYGGKVLSIPFQHTRSTTALLRKIRSTPDE